MANLLNIVNKLVRPESCAIFRFDFFFYGNLRYFHMI